MKPFLYLDNYRDAQPPTRVDLALARKDFPVVRMRTNDGEFPTDEECYRRCEIVGERSVRKCSYRGVRKGRSWAVRPQRRRFFNRMRKKIP